MHEICGRIHGYVGERVLMLLRHLHGRSDAALAGYASVHSGRLKSTVRPAMLSLLRACPRMSAQVPADCRKSAHILWNRWPEWGHVRLWKFGLGSLGAISAGTRRGRPKLHGPRPGRRGTAGTSPGIPPARWAGERERAGPGHPPRRAAGAHPTQGPRCARRR